LTQLRVMGVGTEVKLVNSQTTLDRVRISCSNGTGIEIDGGSPALNNIQVDIFGSRYGMGVKVESSRAKFVNLTISTDSIRPMPGLVATGSAVTLTDSRIQLVSSYGTTGIRLENSSLDLTNVTIDATGELHEYSRGIINVGDSPGTVLINRSTILIREYGIVNESAYTVKIGGSQLGGKISGPGTFTCTNSYTPDFVSLGPNCL